MIQVPGDKKLNHLKSRPLWLTIFDFFSFNESRFCIPNGERFSDSNLKTSDIIFVYILIKDKGLTFHGRNLRTFTTIDLKCI